MIRCFNGSIHKEQIMSALETAIAAVQASTKLGAGQKDIVIAFLQAAGPAVESLGESGLSAVLGTAAAGGAVAETVAAHLDAPGVAALLALTETQMAALADRHAAEVQAARAAMAALQAAALGVLARALIGVL